MNVLVLGAGGLGSYVGAVLARSGHDVALVVRGAHGDVIRAHGLTVETPEGSFVARPRCLTPEEAPGAVDVVFLTVKAYSLDDIAETTVTLARDGALIVPLLNGVDVSARLERAGVPAQRLVDGIAYLTAFRTGPGRIERKGTHQRLVVGSSTGLSDDRLEELRTLFRETPIEVAMSPDIQVELWLKMAVVCSLAIVCGITGSDIGPIREHAFGRDLQARAIGEVLSVGRATGVRLPADAEARVGRTLDAFPADFHPSVLHDLRQGRRTEMDPLCGTIARLGRALHLDTPLVDAATCAVALTEARMTSAEAGR
jgi:2-dehydropantoate 2-reductase